MKALLLLCFICTQLPPWLTPDRLFHPQSVRFVGDVLSLCYHEGEASWGWTVRKGTLGKLYIGMANKPGAPFYLIADEDVISYGDGCQ